jgi:pyruvate kinase
VKKSAKTVKSDDVDPATKDDRAVEDAYQQVQALHDDGVELEKSMTAVLDDLQRHHKNSARNLLHYVAFRRHDIRDLQGQLSALGLSSLGRSEACILKTLQQVLRILRHIARKTAPVLDAEPPINFDEGQSILARNTTALFGPPPAKRPVHVMVTMSTEAAENYEHVRALLASGMDCMRINCSHDDAAAWQRMIDHLHRATQELQRPCKIMMDLGGPKLRTGPVAPGAAVAKWRPSRDALGRVVAPVRVALTEVAPSVPADADFQITLPRGWLKAMRRDDQITFKDSRGARRELRVVEVSAESARAECRQTAYLVPGLKLRLKRKVRKDWETLETTRLRSVPATEQTIHLRRGDHLVLTADQQPGQPARRDDGDNPPEPARIGCTLPEVFADLKPGEHVWFDDGKIGGRIVRVTAEAIDVEITQAGPDGSKLGADKGINLPDSELHLPSLTAKDRDDLRFVVRHADLVGYSFVRTPNDVLELQRLLHELGGGELGIILKIETRQAFEQLPHLLLAAMHSPRAGVMIARGDLAIECGFERLAEIQEEILWFCEAAHLPVIWATQVLEHLAKEGIPSRAEITDAAMGERAECVMLNKGPHIVEAVRTLDDILTRMAAHQIKKRALLRPLNLAGRFLE